MLADEGMWTFDNLPLKHLKTTYGFEPPPGWAEHLQSAAVRFNSGGSGSFVSADGLVMTNHHVAADTLQKISTKEQDYYKTGFHARTRAEEVKAPDLELNVLVGIEDVTDQVNAGVQRDGLGRGQRRPARGDGRDRAGVARQDRAPERRRHALPGGAVRPLHLQEVHRRPPGVRPRVRHRLLRRRPGQLRVSPVRPRRHLLPGLRERQAGQAAALPRLERDRGEGGRPDVRRRAPGADQPAEHRGAPGVPPRPRHPVDDGGAPRPRGVPAGIRQARPRAVPAVEGGPVRDPEQPESPRRGAQGAERPERDGPQGRGRAGAPRQGRPRPRQAGRLWRGLGQDRRDQAGRREIGPRFAYLERGLAFDSPLFGIARTLVRLAAEKAKPNADRLREYRDSALESLQLELFSEAPTYPDFEKAKLARSLAFWQAARPERPDAARVLAGRTPEQPPPGLVGGHAAGRTSRSARPWPTGG